MKQKFSIFKRKKDETGVALIAVILVMLMLLITTILITMTVMTTQSQTKEFNIYQQSRVTADSGMNSFLSAVNTSRGYTMLETYKTGSTQGSAQRVTPDNALCKTIETTVNAQIGYYPRWCVWTVKVASGTGTTGYYVYSKGFTVPTQSSTLRGNDKDEVVLRMFIEPIIVASNTSLSTSGKVVYAMPATAPFQLGITGNLSVTFEDGSRLYSNQFSRNTAPAGTNTSATAIASEDLISLPNGFVVSALSAPAQKSVLAICTPNNSAQCTDPAHRSSPVSTDMSSIQEFVNAACPNPADSYPSWRGSEHPGQAITPGCYNHVVFDTNMPLPALYSASNPLRINVKGTVEIRSDRDIAKNSDPAAFQIRSTGSVEWAGAGTPQLTTQTHTNAYIASASSCDSSSNVVRRLNINGALACGAVTIGSNTNVYMDTKSQQYGVEVLTGAPQNSIWFQTGVEQL